MDHAFCVPNLPSGANFARAAQARPYRRDVHPRQSISRLASHDR